jgi:hypothetical protein
MKGGKERGKQALAWATAWNEGYRVNVDVKQVNVCLDERECEWPWEEE